MWKNSTNDVVNLKQKLEHGLGFLSPKIIFLTRVQTIGGSILVV
jgi:hypothetical protein